MQHGCFALFLIYLAACVERSYQKSENSKLNVTVYALHPKSLEVHWKNPDHVKSSSAIAYWNRGKSAKCDGSYESSSKDSCTLRKLKDFTEYDVRVQVCVCDQRSRETCTYSPSKFKRTLPSAPEVAKDVKVLAVRPGELNVSWTVPELALGTLASSRAAAFPKGKNSTFCSANAEPYTCVLSELAHDTEYTVVVEVCVTPPDAQSLPDSGAVWCSITPGVQQKTLGESHNSPLNVTVYALRPKSLEVRWNNPPGISSCRAIADQGGYEVATCKGRGTSSLPDSCTLSYLKDLTEYDVKVEVCTKALSDGRYQDSCTTSPGNYKKTLPTAPEVANDVTVRAVKTKELQVSWTIPDLALGKLVSSRAIATLEGINVASCSANDQAYTCVLSELDHATEYTVFVEVCITPKDALSFPESGVAWCSNTTGVQKKTLSQSPEVAKDVRVLAVHTKELLVSWAIPDLALGSLASSRAIVFLGERNVTSCSANAPPHTCVLSKLNHATDYRVVVEVCITPPDVESFPDSAAVWCSLTTGVQKKTLSEFPEKVKDVRVWALRTQELQVSWTIPHLAGGKPESTKATAILNNRAVSHCSVSGWTQTCVLSKLNHATDYRVIIEFCVTPSDAVSYPQSDGAWCSTTTDVRKKTLPEFPEKAQKVLVDAVKTQELQASWTIPYLALGTLRSSRAIAILNEKEVTQCSASGSKPACVLSGLAHATEYKVVVEVCVTPTDAISSHNSAAAWCSTTTGLQKKTLTEDDNSATNVAVFALRPKSLEMRWHNPGGIVSSQALAFQGGNIVATCNGSGTPFSADSCSLNNLLHFTTYDVSVSVCVYHWWYKMQCKTSPVKRKTTLPSAPEVAKDVRVLAVHTKELLVSWTIPDLALGSLASSRAIVFLGEANVTSCSANAPPHTCVLSKLNHATDYRVVVEVCVTPPDVESFPDSAAVWCSLTTGVQKKTLSEFPEKVKDVRVRALRTQELQVSWTIPHLAGGKPASTRATAILNNRAVSHCSVSGWTQTCVLSKLNHATDYRVIIEFCVTPSDAVSCPQSDGAWCSIGTGAQKKTLPEFPQTARQLNVLAVQTQELRVSWTIPNLAGGKLASSRAIAILNEREVSQCSGAGWSPYCFLSKLAHATNYTVVVEVCVTPPDAESSRASYTAWCSKSSGVHKQTLPQHPEMAHSVSVLATRTSKLSVTWRNPVPASGALASSRATAMVGDLAQTECKPDVTTEGPAECTLSGLATATDYTIIIEVCITPPDARSYRYSRTAWCSRTGGFRKRTLPEFPDSAKDVVVLAIQQKEFVVEWTVPDLSVGTLASSKAIASLDGEGETVTRPKVAQCSPEVSPQGRATCTLSGLSPSSKYAVSVELCFIPADVAYPLPSHSDWCSISGPVSKQTLPQFPEKATSVIVQAVQGHALTVSWINPDSAYGTVVSAKSTARLRKQTAEAANCTISDAKPGPATCVLSGLEDFTYYEVFVQVCISPEDAVHWNGLRSDWCSVSAPVQKQTLPGVPDAAVGVKVHSPSRNVLSVDWTNPSASHGFLASSTAFAMLNNSTKSSCSGKLDAALRTSCNITGLEDFTNYSVAVHVCVFPVQFEPGYWSGGGCSTTPPILKQTLPGGPDMASRTAVFARQQKCLEVSWINPDATHGPLANSTAIGLLRGSRVASCQADILPGQPVRCTLTNLLNFEAYNVSVEVCVAPVQAGSNEFAGGGCSVTPTISGTTLPGVFDAVHLEELSRQIPNSTQIVEDPSTQISIKVALSSLPTKQVGPVSYVTAYIESPSQTDGTWTRNRRYAGRFSFLSGSYNNKTWEPWEVMAWNFQGDSPKKVEDFFFTVGQPSATQTCDHCYNGPLKPDTIYRIGLRVYTNSGAGTTELSEFKTAPAPVNIGLVVGVISAFLVILVVIALAVHFFMRQRGPDPKKLGFSTHATHPVFSYTHGPTADRHRVFVAYKRKEIPAWDRSEIPLPIIFAEFNLNVKRMQSDAEATKEFLALANLTKKQNLEYELTEDLAATVPKLNRYGDMTPYDQSIVRLDRNWVAHCANQHPMGPLQSEVLEVYVNANYVKACHYDNRGQAQIAADSSLPEYIATQGPLKHTEADFLYMVYQQRAPIVIILCNTTEGGKSKCAQYWPDSCGVTEEKCNLLRSIDVTLNDETHAEHVVTRSMTVQPEGDSDSWTFTQLHFLSWADHAVPPIAEFYDFLKNYAYLRQQKPLSSDFGPTVVHCSAGVGRTGTLICAQVLLDQLRTNPQTIDIFGTVLALRVFRKRLVQVKEQLRFLYDFLAYCIQKEGITGAINPIYDQILLEPRLLPLQFPTPVDPPPAYTPSADTEAGGTTTALTKALPPRPALPPANQQFHLQTSDVCPDTQQPPLRPSYRRPPQADRNSESYPGRPGTSYRASNQQIE